MSRGLPTPEQPYFLLSFVGRRPAATAVAALTWAKHFRQLAGPLRLLATDETRWEGIADRLVTLLGERGLAACALPIADVRTASAVLRNAPLPHPANGPRVVFLVDSGPGFAVAKLARELRPWDPVFVSVRRHELIVGTSSETLPGTLAAERLHLDPLLDLHDVSCTARNGRDIPTSGMPDDAIKGGRLKYGDEPDLVLDAVWEQHGVVHGRVAIQASDSDRRKNQVRAVASRLATGVFANLQPQIEVCTDAPAAIAEALSAGLAVIRENGDRIDAELPLTGTTIDDKSITNERSQWSEPKLIARLGSNAASTMLALQTHRPTEAILFIDDTPHVGRTVARLRDLAAHRPELLPKRLRFEKTSGDGRLSAAQVSLINASEGHINITPGTKLQKAMLAIQTERPLWSIDRKRNRAVPLTGSGTTPCIEPVPLAVLLHMVPGLSRRENVWCEGDDPLLWHEDVIRFHLQLATGIADHLTVNESERANGFRLCTGQAGISATREKFDVPYWHQRANAAAASAPCYENKFRGSVQLPGGRTGFVRDPDRGDWLEDVVAASLTNAPRGRHIVEIRVGAEPRYGEGIGDYLRQQDQQLQEARTDADVVARIDNELFLFDCKAGKDPDLPAHRRHATADARTLGRFCVPIAVRPWVDDSEKEDKTVGAAAMDLRDMLKPDLIGRLLALAAIRRQFVLPDDDIDDA